MNRKLQLIDVVDLNQFVRDQGKDFVDIPTTSPQLRYMLLYVKDLFDLFWYNVIEDSWWVCYTDGHVTLLSRCC